MRVRVPTAAPEAVWENYLLLARIEQAFKDMKGDLRVRPIWHQVEKRIEAISSSASWSIACTQRCAIWREE